MGWARIDDDFPNHPKVWRVGAEGVALFLEGLCHASKFLTDGLLAGPEVERMRLVKKPLSVAQKLVEVGLWEKDGENFRIHDYHDYNMSAKAVRERKAANRERVANWRETKHVNGSNASGNALHAAHEQAHTRAGTPEARGRAVGRDGISSDISEGEPEREPPLPAPMVNQSAHRRHAFCGRVCVPDFMHERFVRQSGTDEADAIAALRAWYLEEDRKWQHRAVGDKPEEFWAARFKERTGTTVAVSGPRRSVAAQVEADWRRRCREERHHQPPCGTPEHCDLRVDRERRGVA